MSFFGLNIAGNALSASQEAANVTSDNISNVSTPGASRQQANIIAQAAGVSIAGVQSINLGETFSPQPMREMAAMSRAAPAAPISAGTDAITATVNVVYRIR